LRQYEARKDSLQAVFQTNLEVEVIFVLKSVELGTLIKIKEQD
jgi:hypothetical protein